MADIAYDTRFTLPNADDPPSVETGVILLGLDADRLLAGLGVASCNDDPGLVALAVDQLRHGVTPRLPIDAMIAAGARRWRDSRAALDTAGGGNPATGSARQAYTHAVRRVDAAAAAGTLGDAGPATRAYLAACWLRRHDVDPAARSSTA